MAIRQLTIFVEDKQGKLVEITRLLAENDINMRALSIADSKTLTVLADAGINVEYLYAFLASKGQGAYVVLRVADNKAAEKALTKAGYLVLNDADCID